MNKSTPAVSIIVPAFNTGPYIRKCIESIISQTFSDWELFVVDDGSTDDTYDTALSISETDDRITVIRGDATKLLEDMERDRIEKNENILREGVPDTQYVEMNGNPDVGDETDGGFDFVFIDAAKSHYREFFEAAEKICTRDALIVCDNILLNGWILEADGKDAKRHRTSIKYMKKFLDYLRQRDDIEVSILTGADGLAIIRFVNED
jgi:predicted O-methyltransferase YrrM